MKYLICFIDDSDFEHDLIRNEIAPFTPALEFLQAYTFDEAKDRIGQAIPSLFLLDLWGKDESVRVPYLASKIEVEERIAQFPTLDQVYGDLDQFKGDVNNEFLKRFFSVVESWRSLFEDLCAQIGQNRKYGLSNLQMVRKHFPAVPAVFYTRKSLINDAVAMLKAGTDGLFIKPTGANDTKTRLLTREYAPQLASELIQIIKKKPSPG